MGAITELPVALGQRSYRIHVGAGLLERAGELLAPHLQGRQAVVVSNDCVAPLFMAELLASFDADLQVDQFLLPDGEAAKNLENFQSLLEFLLTRRHNRTTTVIALGGGVVGDLAGFAAATYQRGVSLIQIPTTLLAQVDSSVGGKTAVNHPLGKNMIGAFHQPRSVLIDTDVLRTLPEREYRAGLAEVIKYGVLHDAELFTYLENTRAELLARDPAVLHRVIVESCRIKALVVSEDERESGARAKLNYGHTFGHALENLAGYGTLLHGEAVAIGMVQAADFACRIGLLESDAAMRQKQLLAGCGLPVAPPPNIAADDLIAAMTLDKKTADGKLRFVLASRIGQVAVHEEPDRAALRATLCAGTALCESS